MSVMSRAGNGKITVPDILSRKSRFSTAGDSKRKITCVTAYDYPTARLLDEAGVDVLLVGDSLGMAVLGYESTIPVTLEECAAPHVVPSGAERVAHSLLRTCPMAVFTFPSRNRFATRSVS